MEYEPERYKPNVLHSHLPIIYKFAFCIIHFLTITILFNSDLQLKAIDVMCSFGNMNCIDTCRSIYYSWIENDIPLVFFFVLFNRFTSQLHKVFLTYKPL